MMISTSDELAKQSMKYGQAWTWKISRILIVRYTTFIPSIAPKLTHYYIILLDLEFDDSTKLLLELLHWKSKGSTFNHNFQRLRNILALQIKLPAMSTR